jgi:DNA modification methylase
MTTLESDLFKVFFHSCENMDEIPNSLANLIISSPPYNNRPKKNSPNKADYKEFIFNTHREFYRILKPGGVLVSINTDLRDHARYNNYDKGFEGLIWQRHIDIRQVCESLGFRCTDTKIWVKNLKQNRYRYTYSYIIFLYKHSNQIPYPYRPKVKNDEFGPDVWLLENGTYRKEIRTQPFRDAIHPEIASRCIRQFTRPGELVVSPFAGSGTIISVANRLRRKSIGYEINKNLKFLIRESVENPQGVLA